MTNRPVLPRRTRHAWVALALGLWLAAPEGGATHLCGATGADRRSPEPCGGAESAAEEACPADASWSADSLLRLEAVGHVGGAIRAVDCDAGRCFVALGDRVGVVDVTDPSRPALLGETELLPASPLRIAATGDRAYVLCGAQILVIDGREPSRPRVAGGIGGFPTALQPGARLAASGPYAFVAGVYWSQDVTRGSLRVVEATDPEQPRVVASVDLPGLAPHVGLDVLGQRVYVANGDLGVRIVDVSDPRQPQEIGSVPVRAAGAVKADGSRLYVSEPRGLAVYDVADPAAPRSLGRWIGLGADELGVVGDRVLLLNAGWGVLALDVADPAAMVAAGTYRDDSTQAMDCGEGIVYLVHGDAGLRLVEMEALQPARVAGDARLGAVPRGIDVDAGTVYVAAGDEGLRIVDVRDPAAPRDLAGLDTPGSAMAVAVVEGHAYVADGEGGLRVVDVQDPQRPREVGSWSEGPAMDVDVAGSLGYVVGWRGTPNRPELSVLDLASPSAPRRIGRIETSSYHGFHLRVVGTSVFVLGNGGIDVIDVSAATAPRPAGRIAVRLPTDFDATTQHLLVADPTMGLLIVDASDPTAASTVATLTFPGSTDRVAVVGDVALIAGRFDSEGGRWVRTVEFSEPSRPRETSFVELADHPAPFGAPFAPSGDIDDVALDGDIAYVATDYYAGGASAMGHVLAIDARDAAAAREIGAVATISGDLVSAADGRAYILDGGVLQIVDVSDPSAPRQIGQLPGMQGGTDVVARGRAVYAIDTSGGLVVIDATDAAGPRVLGRLQVAEQAAGLDVVDGVAYAAAAEGGLRLVDVRDPASPRALGSVDTGWAADVAVSGTRAFVVGAGRLAVVDVSDARAPVVIGAAETGASQLVRVAVGGNMAYVVSSWPEGELGLAVVDCTDPTAPRVVVRSVGAEYWTSVAADAEVPAVYAADAFATLHLIDVSTPASPRQLAAIDLAARQQRFGPSPAAIDLGGGYAFVATSGGGLDIVRAVTSPVAARLCLPFAVAAPGG